MCPLSSESWWTWSSLVLTSGKEWKESNSTRLAAKGLVKSEQVLWQSHQERETYFRVSGSQIQQPPCVVFVKPGAVLKESDNHWKASEIKLLFFLFINLFFCSVRKLGNFLQENIQTVHKAYSGQKQCGVRSVSTAKTWNMVDLMWSFFSKLPSTLPCVDTKEHTHTQKLFLLQRGVSVAVRNQLESQLGLCILMS